jgi:hypothetical protein
MSITKSSVSGEALDDGLLVGLAVVAAELADSLQVLGVFSENGLR